MSKFQGIEDSLKTRKALPALDALVSAGCDRNELLRDLDSLRKREPKLDDWESFTGTDLKGLKRLIDRIRKIAAELQTINMELGMLFIVSRQPHLVPLPKHLKEYARWLEASAKFAGPQKNLVQNLDIYDLTRNVHEKTKRWHDREVSELMSAVLAKPNYDEVAHRMWRNHHYDFLDSCARMLPPEPPPTSFSK